MKFSKLEITLEFLPNKVCMYAGTQIVTQFSSIFSTSESQGITDYHYKSPIIKKKHSLIEKLNLL
jgi:hypothetical protein